MTPTEFETLKLSGIVFLGAVTLLALSVCPWLVFAWVDRHRPAFTRFRSRIKLYRCPGLRVLRSLRATQPQSPSLPDPSRYTSRAEPSASGSAGAGAPLSGHDALDFLVLSDGRSIPIVPTDRVDLHTINAAGMFGVCPSQVTSEQRRWARRVHLMRLFSREETDV